MDDKRPLRVLVLDSAWPMMAPWAVRFAKLVRPLNVHLVVATDQEKSSRDENLEFINIHDAPTLGGIDFFEKKYGFSIYRTLAAERAYFDYTSFTDYEKYSRLSLEEIAGKVTPYINAYDYIVREKIDIVIDSLADSFRTSLLTRIAAFYQKGCFLTFSWYWWKDGILFLDRVNQTSSTVDKSYAHYMAHPADVDVARVRSVFNEKRAAFLFQDSFFKLDDELNAAVIKRRSKSYDPRSQMNWLLRKFRRRLSAMMIRVFANRLTRWGGEPFVCFPVHLMPEAALLGNTPEIADQFSVIKNISMNLPFGVKLYVKEYPHQILGVGIHYDFYRKLASLPNVKVIRGDADLKAMMSSPECLAVAVVNGTAGLEAALLKKPVFVFGEAVYGRADCFLKPKDFDEFSKQMVKIKFGEFTFNETALNAMLAALDANVVRADSDFARNTSFIPQWDEYMNVYKAFIETYMNRKG